MLKLLGIQALYSISGGLIQKVIPFVATLYVARTVGQEEFATFAFAINTANTITAVIALGLAPAILTSLSGTDQGGVIDKKISAIFMLSASYCLIAAAIGVLSTGFSFKAIENSKDLAGIAILAPALILLQTTQSVYQGTNRHHLFLTQSVVLTLAVFSIFKIRDIFLTSSLNTGLVYSCAFLLVGVAFFFRLILSMDISFRNAKLNFLLEVRSFALTQLPFAGYTSIWMLAVYLCNFRIADEFNAVDLAYFNIGFQLYSLMLLVPATLGGVLIPFFSRSNYTNSDDNKAHWLSYIYSAAAILIASFLYMAAPFLLKVYGVSISPNGIATVRFLGIAGGIAFALTPSLQKFMAMRRFRILMSISACWSLVALTGSYFFSANSADVAFSFLAAYCVVAIFITIVKFTVVSNSHKVN